MPVSIGRNPFARHDLVREIVRTQKGCSWCGQNFRGRLFAYGHHPDGIYTRPAYLKGEFCSIDCCRSYHDGQPQ